MLCFAWTQCLSLLKRKDKQSYFLSRESFELASLACFHRVALVLTCLGTKAYCHLNISDLASFFLFSDRMMPFHT